MRGAVTLVIRWILRLFFRRLEAAGLDRLPREGPVVAVLNHPNGLLDPAVLLALSPRPVSFLAKAPLFRTPLVSLFVKGLDCIPVHRPQDGGASPERTRETFARARDVLAAGGVIGLFPEGTTHDDPSLKPLKSGAARLALGAAARLRADGGALRVVPAGLFFPRKTVFRSDALLVFGEPFEVAAAPETDLGPDPRAVRALTARISEALARVTLQADATEALELAAAAEGIVREGGGGGLEESFDVRHRLLAGYPRIRDARPAEVADVTRRLRRHVQALSVARLDPASLQPLEAAPAAAAWTALLAVGLGLVALPFALAGLVTHLPAWLLVDALSRRYARGDDSVLATGKLVCGMVLYPLTWLLLALAVLLRAGAAAGICALVLLPLSGAAALAAGERLEAFASAARALALLLFRRRAALRLLAERRALRGAILALARAAAEGPVPALPNAGSAPG